MFMQQKIQRRHPFPWGTIFTILILGLFSSGILSLVFFYPRIIGSKPVLAIMDTGHQQVQTLSIGKTPRFLIDVANNKSGVCEVTAKVSQNGMDFSLALEEAEQEIDPNDQSVKLVFVPSFQNFSGLNEGPATLESVARNCAWLARKTSLTMPVEVDLIPPTVALTSTQHYINQGGADVATYHVSPDTVWSGVKVGGYVFNGHVKPGTKNSQGERFSFFVFSYELPQNTPIEIVAIDAAGNEAQTTLVPAKFFAKQFRHRDLPVDDQFIQTKVFDIMANTPGLSRSGDLLKDYLSVNRDLRKKNAAQLVEVSKKSDEKFYWKDAFRPLTNASVEANFADYRNYIYNGQKVDEQVHLGFDLAVVEKHPILAAADGRVLFAGYMGIYGNTIIIDHGYGLMTLYGHLSSMDVSEGQEITKEQKIGNSGATGLAGGDHLHFSMLIDGVQTNPIEFWDQHWIHDHVYLRVKL